MQDEHYEFGAPTDRQPVQDDGSILPVRRFDVRRRDDPEGRFNPLGWVEVALRTVKTPPAGHAAVAVVFTASVNLTAVVEPWDGKTERRMPK
jgi:hypothetical protein